MYASRPTSRFEFFLFKRRPGRGYSKVGRIEVTKPCLPRLRSRCPKRRQSTDPAEPQIRRYPSLARGLAAVARHGVAVPRLLPIDRALRGPEKIGTAHQVRQRPRAIIVNVADEAEFAVCLQN